MDNLCHTLVGAAMGEAGLKTRTRFASPALMAAANLPDLDVLVFLTDTSSLEFRRGWTHGVPAQLILPLALTAVCWAIDRYRPPTREGPRFHAGWLLFLAYAGIYSHVFLDFLNTYGVRLLAPFDWRWFYGDAVFIIDPWLWLALGLGVWRARRQTRRRPARIALVIASLYVIAMLGSARLARAMVTDIWTAEHGRAPRALMVGPVPLSPLRKDVIVDAGDRYYGGSFDWWTRTVTWAPETIPRNDGIPEVAAVRGDPRIRPFLVWSRFPFWVIEPDPTGTRVRVRDRRFVGGGRTFEADVRLPAP